MHSHVTHHQTASMRWTTLHRCRRPNRERSSTNLSPRLGKRPATATHHEGQSRPVQLAHFWRCPRRSGARPGDCATRDQPCRITRRPPVGTGRRPRRETRRQSDFLKGLCGVRPSTTSLDHVTWCRHGRRKRWHDTIEYTPRPATSSDAAGDRFTRCQKFVCLGNEITG